MSQTTSRKKAAAGHEVDLALVEASSVVSAIVVGTDGTIRAANACMRRFLGSSDGPSRSSARLPDYFVDPTAWDRWCDAAREGRFLEIELRGSDGETKVFRGDVSAQGEGAEQRFVGILVEGDDNKALRAAAQHSARMEALGSLTAGVAHDFNNLLTVLVGNLYLVGEEVRERPRVFEKLKAARDAGKRGTELIKQLMTFARREQLEVGIIDPAKVVGELLPLLRRALGSRITLETTLPEQAGLVRASVAQLESVVVNLAVNARDAIEGNGRISIEVAAVEIANSDAPRRGLSRGGRYVAVVVRDTGAGIPPEALRRVFDPFFSTKRERGGTGLGLSMVRWFAENSGGRAAIESKVGQGTAVTVLLPRQQAAHTTQAAEDKTMPLSTLPTGSERVVVLAVDEALRTTIHETLAVLGYRVDVKSDAQELLAGAAGESVDLLMIDGIGRIDAVALMRVLAARPQLRVIATTETGRAPERIAGVTTVPLAKPFTLGDLAGTVRRTLDGAAIKQ